MTDDFDPAPGPAGRTPRMEPTPYRPDGEAPLGGVVVMLGVVLLSATLTGVLASWLHLLCCLTGCLVSPLMLTVIGLTGSLVGVAAVGAGKVRRPVLAGFTGLLGMVVTLLAMVFTDYVRLIDNPAKAPPGVKARVAANDYDFDDYLADIKPSEGLMLTLCLLVVGPISYFAMASAAAHPFCPGCQRWKYERRLGALEMMLPDAVRALSEGDLVALTDGAVAAGSGPLELSVYACRECEEGGSVEAHLALRADGDKSKRTSIGVWTYPGAALPVLTYLFRRRPPAPPEP